MNSPFIDGAGVISTRKPGCVFKQKDITDTIINNTEAQATICIGRVVRFFIFQFCKGVAAIPVSFPVFRVAKNVW